MASASSTHEGSYFDFFIRVPQEGHTLYALPQDAPHAEQMYSSAQNRCVRCVQRAGMFLPPVFPNSIASLFRLASFAASFALIRASSDLILSMHITTKRTIKTRIPTVS